MHARPFPRRAAARAAVVAAVVAATLPVLAPSAVADPLATEGRIVFQNGTQLATMRSDGTDIRQLTTNTGFAPTWSPDGTRVAFGRSAQIWSISADGTGERQLTSNFSGSANPSWSPDGSTIAFISSRSGGGNQLFLMNADGTGESQLTSSPVTHVGSLDWSPDGSALVFQGTVSGVTGLHVVRVDGSDVRRLTAGTDIFPTWSPDGSAIVFARSNGPLRDLYRISPAGGTPVQLTATPAEDEIRPALSPDGQQLLYDSGPATTGARRLVTAGADGSNPQPLTDGINAQDGEYSPAGAGGEDPVGEPGTGSGSTSAGQTLDLAITGPAPAAEQPASTEPLEVTGTVDLSASATRPYNAAYVVDVSGSTTQSGGLNCDGTGGVTNADDFNGDFSFADILDCEIAAVIALNNAVAGVPSAVAGVIALGGAVPSGNQVASVLADMSPQAGDQSATSAGAVAAGQTRGHVETVLRSMRAGQVGQYTAKTLGSNTDYDAALERMNAFFLGRSGPATNVGYFMSDGEPNAGTFDTTLDGPLQMAVYRGTRVFTYAVGTNAGGCGTGQPLRLIADRTGGTCTAVSNPALLAAAVSTPATLDSVSVRLDSGTPVTATVDDSTAPPSWTATIPGGLPPGPHTLTAVARASDGSTVTATGTVTGLAAPVVDAGGPYAVDEGSTLTLAGTATDADGSPPDVAWTPADGLTEADTLEPTYSAVDDDEVTFTLTATDEDGLTATDTATVTTVNVAPALGTASLDPRPVTGAPFKLSVPFTDPGSADTHSATIDWGDGSTEDADVTPSDDGGGTVTGSHTYGSGGDRTITVTVTDDDGGEGSTQTGPFRVNTAPDVSAGGPYAVDEGTALALDGTATDADGDPLSTTWSPADRVADPASPTSAYDTTDDADEVLTLTAVDGDLVTTAQARVTVHNVPPALADLTAPTDVVPPGEEVVVTASYADPGTADTHAVTVDWGDGTVDEQAVSGGELSARHTYTAGGTWTVTVTLADDDGGTDTATTAVVTNRSPVVAAGEDLVTDEGGTARLDATATDPDGDALTYAWTPADAVVNATVEDAEVQALDDGSRTLTLTATDPHGAEASDRVEVTVRNVAPSVDTLTGPAGSPGVGQAVQVSGTFSDPGTEDTHTATVDWGDGTTGEGVLDGGTLSAEHTYVDAGLYTVTVRVTDDDGGAGTRTLDDLPVHDRAGGFVTGGGTIDSPTGRATVAAAAMYVPLVPVPVGVTSLQLHGEDLAFRATGADWLVVDGVTATYRGTGTVNGRGGYGFTVTVTDARAPASSSGDRFRLRVWDQDGGAVVYDSGTAALRSGNLVVHG